MLDLEIAERREDPREDILSMLVQARFEGGEPMDDAEIRDQLMTLLLAGHETTATGLAWTFDLLVRNPAVLDRLVHEIDADDQAYVRAVVTESLRLRPVVPLAGRRLTKPLEVDGHELAPGTDVTPAIWLAHTRADRYPEPFAFRPERFLDGAPATSSLGPVRRWRAAVHRRGVRRDGDAGRADGDPQAPDAASGDQQGRARRPPQRHVLAGGRHAGDRPASARGRRRVEPRLRPVVDRLQHTQLAAARLADHHVAELGGGGRVPALAGVEPGARPVPAPALNRSPNGGSLEPRSVMEAISLEPVDAVTVTTLVDNVTDLLLPDAGPAKRPSIAQSSRPTSPRASSSRATGDALRAEHGFSCLVTITKAAGPPGSSSTPGSRRTG